MPDIIHAAAFIGLAVFIAWDRSRLQTFKEVIAYCESMLGYSGSMPSEVENQSEDAGMEVHHA